MGENTGVGAAWKTAPNHIDAAKDSEDMTTPTRKRTTSPAFQFYPKDFMTSPKVMNMSATERGIYISLLCVCWLEGGLPDDKRQLAGFARVPVKQLERLWSRNLQACFTLVRNGWLVNDRLDKERKKQIAFRDRQAVHGKKGGRRVAKGEPKGSPSPRVMEREDRKEEILGIEERGDVAFVAFQREYPPSRRKGGLLVEQSFLVALSKAGGSPRLLSALRNHLASEQWSNPKHIPGMDRWLDEELWRQELPPADAATSSANNPKTAGNVGVFNRFVERGRTA